MSYKNSSNTTLLIGEKKIKPGQSVPNPDSEGQKFNKDLSRFIDLGLVEKEAEKKAEPKQKAETSQTSEGSKKSASKSSKATTKASKTAAKEESTEPSTQQTETQESTVGANHEGDQNDKPTDNQDSSFGL